MKTDTSNLSVRADANAEKPAAQPRKGRMVRAPKRDDDQPSMPASEANKVTPEPKEPRGPSKIASVIAKLEREQGATLAEMVEATGWLPHTTRAALTGLKKRGQVITKDKRDDVTCYRIAKAAQ